MLRTPLRVDLCALFVCSFLFSLIAPSIAQPPTTTGQPTAAPAPIPLPAIQDLLEQATTQQRASWNTLRHYTYHSFNSEQDLDSHGTVKKTTTKELETICVDIGCYPRLLAVDGKPLSDDAMKQQNDSIDRRLAWNRDRNAKRAAGLPPPPPLKKSKGDDLGDDNTGFANFLGNFLRIGPKLGSFSNPRRVELHGRECIALDYLGNPHAKSPSLIDGVFRNTAATVWVDEQDHALVRIEGRVFEDYKVGAGLLANVHKGATLEMEWTKVNDEVWLPASFRGRGSARILVFSSHSEALEQRWSDYRKFRTTSTILPGAAEVTAPETVPHSRISQD